MTRTVFRNDQVPHLWANQSQDQARGGGSISFSGTRLYSYAAVIGNLVMAPNDVRIALLSSDSWSVTTSSHQSAARIAVRHLVSYTVPNVQPVGEADHADNLAYLVKEYRDAVDATYRKRSLEEWVCRDLGHKWQHAVDYAGSFLLAVPQLDLKADIAALDAYHNGPDKVALRAKRNAEKKAAELAARETRRLAHAQAVAEWRCGQRYSLGYEARLDDQGGALLRIANDELQTSLGATVPLAHAINVFKRVAACRASGMAWHRNGECIRVGSFQVDQINPDGSFRAGCHLINWPEIERAAQLAGVL